MLRNIAEYKGDCLIIGGGWCAHHKGRKSGPLFSWRNPENFFTIDYSKAAEADLCADITLLTIDHQKKFRFILFEDFGLELSNNLTASIKLKDYQQAFNNARKLLKDDGLLVFVGGYLKKHLKNSDAQDFSDLFELSGFAYADQVLESDSKGLATLVSWASMDPKIDLKNTDHLPQAAKDCLKNWVKPIIEKAAERQQKENYNKSRQFQPIPVSQTPITTEPTDIQTLESKPSAS